MIAALLLVMASMVAAGPFGREDQFWMTTGLDQNGIDKLHTRVTYPKNFDPSKKYTAIMDRSPYGYKDLEWIADLMVPFDFVAFGQDMRGTGYSTGNFTMWHSDNDDGEKLGDWIVSQPWSNGKVYTFGGSADGLASFTVAHNKPSWLVGQYIVWSSAQAYEILFPNGAYLYHLVTNWLHGTVRPYDLDHSMDMVYKNEAKTAWWKPLDMAGEYADIVNFPSGMWSGWYDIFLPGNLMSYAGYNDEASDGMKHNSRLLVDPLGHCQDGAEFFPQDLVGGRTLLGLAQMLETYGIRDVSRNDIKNITYYVMSSNDTVGLETANYWTTMEVWPEYESTNFYLHASGAVLLTAPEDDETPSTTYTYDPSDPVLGFGGNNLSPLECGPQDQRASEDGRADVLQFDSEEFVEPFFMTGPLFAKLYVSSDAIDTDFTVKMSDVYPTGEVRLIMDQTARMRWREGGLDPVYMEDGIIYPVDVNLWNTSMAMAPGHKLRVSISSSNYPRFSINPNNGLLLADENYPGQNITAQNTLYHSAQYPSHLILPQVQAKQQPKIHNLKSVLGDSLDQIENLDDIVAKASFALGGMANLGRH
jgi:predicted acyl esterase